MTERQHQHELTPEELDEEAAAELPDREAMSLINANIAIPVNAAVAANVLSDGAVAYADATQESIIDQSTGDGATFEPPPGDELHSPTGS
jgi:hypothetical protein